MKRVKYTKKQIKAQQSLERYRKEVEKRFAELHEVETDLDATYSQLWNARDRYANARCRYEICCDMMRNG